jgi:putative salt-induced outer membrane protein YdiY
MRRSSVALLALLASIVLSRPARADDPKFEYVAKPDIKEGDPGNQWKANVQFGLTWLSGNAESIGFTGTGLVAYRNQDDQLQLFANGAYGKGGTSTVPGGPIDGHSVIADNWLGKIRYDRFFEDVNSAYASYQMNGDQLAGLAYRAEPQIGYSRIFVNEKDRQKFRGDIGLDFSYERYLSGVDPNSANFQSLRLFLYYENQFTPLASFSEGLEGLMAFNVLSHWRVNSLTSFTSTLSKTFALKLNLTLTYNHDPPMRPPPNTTPFERFDSMLAIVLAITIA